MRDKNKVRDELVIGHLACVVFAVSCISRALQEEELRKGGEAKYAHLAMELHVFIEVTAPIPEAYLRMAHAMDEVKKFLIPVRSGEPLCGLPAENFSVLLSCWCHVGRSRVKQTRTWILTS